MRFLLLVALFLFVGVQLCHCQGYLLDSCHSSISNTCQPAPEMEEVCCMKGANDVSYCRYKCRENTLHAGSEFDFICTDQRELFPRHCNICSDPLEKLTHKYGKRNWKCRGDHYCDDVCRKHKCSTARWDCNALQHPTDRVQCKRCWDRCRAKLCLGVAIMAKPSCC